MLTLLCRYRPYTHVIPSGLTQNRLSSPPNPPTLGGTRSNSPQIWGAGGGKCVSPVPERFQLRCQATMNPPSKPTGCTENGCVCNDVVTRAQPLAGVLL